MRHQVNHFVSTLQQYVESQLSHVSWCRFLYSLKHKVKDMMDLQLVHRAYLSDSLHICFLSDETRPIARIIESILQCALDFRSCLTGGVWNVGRGQGNSVATLSRINIAQVISIKQTFEKNMKELHLCYLRSPKHGEFGLSHFWEYLNYNKYYSDAASAVQSSVTWYLPILANRDLYMLEASQLITMIEEVNLARVKVEKKCPADVWNNGYATYQSSSILLVLFHAWK